MNAGFWGPGCPVVQWIPSLKTGPGDRAETGFTGGRRPRPGRPRWLSFDGRSGSALSGSIGLSSAGASSCPLCPKAAVGQAPRLPRQPRRASPCSGPLPDYRGESPSALAHEDAQPCPSKRCGCLLTVTLAVTLAQRAERPAGLPAENRPPGVTPCPPPLASTHFLSASTLRPPASEDRAGGRAVLLPESELVCAPFAVMVLCVGMLPLVQVSPVLSLIRPLAPGRWPQSSPQPLPGAPAGPAAPS